MGWDGFSLNCVFFCMSWITLSRVNWLELGGSVWWPSVVATLRALCSLIYLSLYFSKGGSGSVRNKGARIILLLTLYL